MRLAIASLLVAAFAFAQPTITPSMPTVNAGSTVDLDASVAGTWALAAGSVGSINAGTGVYTAPTGFRANQVIGGCSLPNDHILVTKVANIPVHADSGTMIAGLPAFAASFQPGQSMNIIDSSTTSFTGAWLYTPQHDGTYQMPGFPDLKVQGGMFSAGPGMGPNQHDVDRHYYGVRRDNCNATEVYKRYAGTDFPDIPAQVGKTGQSGVQYSMWSYTLPEATTNAPGVLSVPHPLTLNDVRNGLKHSVGVTMPNGNIGTGWVWPGTADASNSSVSAPPYASRLRLKAATNIAGYSAMAQTVLQGFKDYGVTIIDGGSSWGFWTDQDTALDPDVVAALAEITAGAIAKTDWEVVDADVLNLGTTGVKTDTADNSYLGQIDPAAYNTHEGSYPPQYAEAVFTATVGGATASKRIVLIPVTVGVSPRQFTTQTGAAAVPLTAWVNGSANQTVSWSCTSGTIVAGSFTPPVVADKTTMTCTAEAAADTGATAEVLITVLPSGAIRIDLGVSANTVDASANTWHAGDGLCDGWIGTSNDPSVNWDNSEGLRTQHGTVIGQRTDVMCEFKLSPNTNYLVSLWAAKPAASSLWREQHVDVGGQICKHDFSMTDEAQWATTKVQCPARTDSSGRLLIGFRQRYNHGLGYDLVYGTVNWSALKIETSVASPQITLDLPLQAPLNIGGTQIAHVLSWWQTPGDATFSLTGVGSIADYTSALPDVGQPIYAVQYTAPMTPQAATVTLNATSVVDNAKTASADIDLEFGTITISPDETTVLRNEAQTFVAQIGGVTYTNVTWSKTAGTGTVGSSSGIYTAPTYLSVDTATTVRATSIDDGTKTADEAFTVVAVTPTIRAMMRAATGTLEDSEANTWTGMGGATSCVADSGSFSTGTEEGATIANVAAEDQYLYKGATYVNQENSMTCTWSVAPGRYIVTLKLADFNPNAHLDSVYTATYSINGSAVLTDFVVPTEAGGQLRAVDRSFVVTATNEIAINVAVTAAGRTGVLNSVQISEVTTPSSAASGKTRQSGKVQAR
jgi:hypothetical protein